MVRAAVFAVTLAGLTLLAAGVLDASPVVFWSTTEEWDAVEHGRRAMLAGAGVTAAAAAALAALGERRAAALVASAAALPVGAVLAAGHSALGLLVLVPALAAGLGGAVLGARMRVLPSAVLGIVVLGAAAAGGLAWGAVVAAALTLGAYLHARAGGAGPRAALASLAPGTAFALVAAAAVLAGAALAA